MKKENIKEQNIKYINVSSGRDQIIVKIIDKFLSLKMMVRQK